MRVSTVISKSVRRAFDVLELFRREQKPLSATAVENALKLPQASASVLIRELAALGYLTYDGDSRTYFPSEHLLRLASWIAALNLPSRRLAGVAEDVSRITRETTSICGRNGRFLQIENYTLGTLTGSIVMQSGRAAPLPCSCAGRAVLATLADEEVLEVIDTVQRRDPQFSFDAAEVLRDMRLARRRNYLATTDLMVRGVGAVAIPLPREWADGHFALVIAAPSPRIREQSEKLVRVAHSLLQRHYSSAPGSKSPGSRRSKRRG